LRKQPLIMKHHLTLTKCLFVFGAMAFAETSAQAGALTYTFEAVASGELGGIVFSDEHFVITAIGDTSNRSSFPNGFTILPDSAQITFDDLNAGAPIDITTRTSVNVNTRFDGVTFGNDETQWDMVLLFDPALDGWELLTPLSPITGQGFVSSSAVLDTSAGSLKFDDANITTTFQALSPSVIAVPTPATLALAVPAVFGLLSHRRRAS